jgi:ribonuclease Z
VSFSVTILGSSSAVPTSERFPSAHLVQAGERFFLIDCGEGTQIQLRRFKIRFGKINHILISHTHGDHVFGLFGLISTLSLLNRTTDLHIYAHPKLKEILDGHLKFFHDAGLPFNIIYHFLNSKKASVIYEDDQISVTAVSLKHRIASKGFIFREKPKPLNVRKEMIGYHQISLKDILKIKNGEDFISKEGKLIPNAQLTRPPFKPRAYAYCSDTAYSEKLIPHLQEIDLLYHEATYGNELAHRAKETAHSTAKQAAEIARKAGVQKLIIGHFSARYKNIEPLLEEAREIFPDTMPANDGMVFEIEKKRLENSGA